MGTIWELFGNTHLGYVLQSSLPQEDSHYSELWLAPVSYFVIGFNGGGKGGGVV